ncbi:MAG: hypothetical protein JSW10_05675 [Pseudomonadota bacterium]|nr:MAG: hypothetical protein JSW10_05675 [Pseudomonadota bacterium]
MADNPPPKLPVVKVMAGALLLPWQQRRRMIEALVIPGVMMLGLWTASSWLPQDNGYLISLPLWFAELVVFAWFAVTCHRLLLCGNNVVPRFGLRRWTWRETRFLAWSIAIYAAFLIFASLTFLAGDLITDAAEQIGEGPGSLFTGTLYTIGILFCTYVMARLCLALPAVAIDKRPDLAWAWNASTGNGWRLVVVVALLPVLVSLLQTGITRDEATWAEILFIDILGVLLSVVEIAALSVAYRIVAEHVSSAKH